MYYDDSLVNTTTCQRSDIISKLPQVLPMAEVEADTGNIIHIYAEVDDEDMMTNTQSEPFSSLWGSGQFKPKSTKKDNIKVQPSKTKPVIEPKNTSDSIIDEDDYLEPVAELKNTSALHKNEDDYLEPKSKACAMPSTEYENPPDYFYILPEEYATREHRQDHIGDNRKIQNSMKQGETIVENRAEHTTDERQYESLHDALYTALRYRDTPQK